MDTARLLGPVRGYSLPATWRAMGGDRLLQAGIFTAAWQRRDWVQIRI